MYCVFTTGISRARHLSDGADFAEQLVSLSDRRFGITSVEPTAWKFARPLTTSAFPAADSHGRLSFITFYVCVLSL
jgi:hypothetical protein